MLVQAFSLSDLIPSLVGFMFGFVINGLCVSNARFFLGFCAIFLLIYFEFRGSCTVWKSSDSRDENSFLGAIFELFSGGQRLTPFFDPFFHLHFDKTSCKMPSCISEHNPILYVVEPSKKTRVF